MDTSFKVSITVLTHRRYNTCRVSGLVQIAITLITGLPAWTLVISPWWDRGQRGPKLHPLCPQAGSSRCRDGARRLQQRWSWNVCRRDRQCPNLPWFVWTGGL